MVMHVPYTHYDMITLEEKVFCKLLAQPSSTASHHRVGYVVCERGLAQAGMREEIAQEAIKSKLEAEWRRRKACCPTGGFFDDHGRGFPS